MKYTFFFPFLMSAVKILQNYFPRIWLLGLWATLLNLYIIQPDICELWILCIFAHVLPTTRSRAVIFWNS